MSGETLLQFLRTISLSESGPGDGVGRPRYRDQDGYRQRYRGKRANRGSPAPVSGWRRYPWP